MANPVIGGTSPLLEKAIMASIMTQTKTPKLKSRAKAPSRSKKLQQKKTCDDSDYCHYTAVYPMMLGLLARGDYVSDIAAYLNINPGIAGVASGEICSWDLEPLDMSQHPPLPCSRESDVSAALDCVTRCRALSPPTIAMRRTTIPAPRVAGFVSAVLEPVT